MAEEQEKATQPEAQEAEAPESLLDDILQATRLKPSDEAYSVTRQGVQAFIDELLKPGREETKISPLMVDEMIADVDRKLGSQLDAIMHNEEFQKLESAWRSLKYLVDKTDFRENIKIEMLNVSKQDLLDDFEDAPEITKSGLLTIIS